MEAARRAGRSGRAGALAPVLIAAAAVAAATAPRSASATDETTARIRRGEYLALHVAQCVQCHTPRDAEGGLDEGRLFEGAAVPVRPPDFAEEWASRAPALAGLRGRKAEIALSVLVDGHRGNGETPMPPMPPFRFERSDAEAIVAYLASLD